jgi:hypothetical protein
MISLRINRRLSSGEVQPGTNFDATVMTDVIAGGRSRFREEPTSRVRSWIRREQASSRDAAHYRLN